MSVLNEMRCPETLGDKRCLRLKDHENDEERVNRLEHWVWIEDGDKFPKQMARWTVGSKTEASGIEMVPTDS